MMEDVAATLAIVVGFSVLAAATGRIVATAVRVPFARHKGHQLELRVDGRTISIDVGAIDKEDPDKLERAIRAVRKTKRFSAAA